MNIKSLKLLNFRNYQTLNIDFEKNYNIIYGDNAQGKTNILEAIYLCASGRSHRTSRDADLIKLGEEKYYVKLDMIKEDIDSSIEISYEVNEKKKIKINEIPVKKIGSLMGQLNAVMFSPEDLLIIKEGPSERRRFVDITLSQIKPTYFFDLQQYNKILTQRNMLLKEIQNKRSLLETLEIWNESLIKTGSKIISWRHQFISRLEKFIKVNHNKLTNGLENLEFKYVPSFIINDFGSLEDIENAFRKELERIVNKEIIKATTLLGPQRDDFETFLNGKSLKLYGSQGQQRTAVLSIKLSEIDIMKEEAGEYPVILLDDVMSELDSTRREYLTESLHNVQVFITSTDKEFFSQKSNHPTKFYNIVNGMVCS